MASSESLRKKSCTRGGFPDAVFLVTLRTGYLTGENTSGGLVTPTTAYRGMYGFWPDLPGMQSSFYILGPGVPKAHALGVIDMRDVAPTLARLLEVRLPEAEGHSLFPDWRADASR
jgi:hypothetical protein